MSPGSGDDTRPDWARARPDYPRTEIAGTIVGVMRLKLLDRGLKLITHWTRAIRRFDVHELILTDAPAGDDVRQRDLRLRAPLVFRPVYTGRDARRASDLQPS